MVSDVKPFSNPSHVDSDHDGAVTLTLTLVERPAAALKAAFHDTDTDILARILART